MAKDMNKGCIIPGDKQKKVSDHFYFIFVKYFRKDMKANTFVLHVYLLYSICTCKYLCGR